MKILVVEQGKQRVANNAEKQGFVLENSTLNQVTQENIRSIPEALAILQNVFYMTTKGCEGEWKYDPSDSLTQDNIGTCVVTSWGGRLKRRIGNYINFSWFLENRDSIIDHTSYFQKCVTVANTAQKRIYAEDGQYILNGNFIINTGIIGQSRLGTIFKLKDNCSLSDWSAIFKLNADEANLFNFTLDGNNQNNHFTSTTGNLGIFAEHIKKPSFENIRIINTRRSGLHLISCPKFSLKGITLENCGRYYQQMPIAQADRIGMLIDNDVDRDSEYFAKNNCVIEDVEITGSGLDGLVTSIGTVHRRITANYNGVEYDNNVVGAAGIYFRPPQSVQDIEVSEIAFIDCETMYNTGLGLDIGSNENSPFLPKQYSVRVSACVSAYNMLNGIGVGGSSRVLIYDNICYNNGRLSSSLNTKRRCGIGVDGVPGVTSEYIRVTNNICFDNQASKTQDAGCYIGGYGPVSNVAIHRNDFQGNKVDAIIFENKNAVGGYLSIQHNDGAEYATYGLTSNIIRPIADRVAISTPANIDILKITAGLVGDTIEMTNTGTAEIRFSENANILLIESTNITLHQNETFIFRCEGGDVWRQINNLNINKRLSPHRKATSNNEHMVGVYINPTFDSSGFTGTRGSAVMIGGAVVPSADNQFGLGAYDLHWSTVRSRKFESLTGDLSLYAGSGYLMKFYSSAVQIGQVSLAGNWLLQNGGTFVDQGERLQVGGDVRITGKFKLPVGANQAIDTVTLSGGTATKANSRVTVSSKIIAIHSSFTGTIGVLSYTCSAGSFTINSSANTDNSTIDVFIFN